MDVLSRSWCLYETFAAAYSPNRGKAYVVRVVLPGGPFLSIGEVLRLRERCSGGVDVSRTKTTRQQDQTYIISTVRGRLWIGGRAVGCGCGEGAWRGRGDITR